MQLELISKEKMRKKKDPVEPFQKSSQGKGIFVIHEHDARRLHYDLRLEMDGVLKSWAIPKEPPTDVGIKRLAIQVDDHDIEYADFEGIIPEGMYGAGTVKIWDRGRFILEKKTSGKLMFELKGEKMIGKYVLVRFKDNWLFFKKG
jgi:DNA ligase D-like protein (predicted 3'-phosphoesterase)